MQSFKLSNQKSEPVSVAWKRLSKKNKIILVSVIAIVAVILIGAANNGPDVKSVKSNSSNPVSSSTTPAKSIVKPENKKVPVTTIDKLWVAVDSTLKDRKDISIDYDSTSKTAFITHSDLDPYKAADVVQQAWAILALWGTEAFKVESIDNINIQNKTTFKDSYGNNSVGTGVVIDMSKTEFIKFNWKNLDHLNIESDIQSASNVYRVVPALRSEIDEDKDLYLVLRYP